MTKFNNYLRVALRNIARQKLFSGLNIIGLAIGLAAFILIVLYVRYELSYDRHHENADRIYRIVRDGRVMTPAALGPALTEKVYDVEAVARVIREQNTLVSRGENHFLEEEFYWASPAIFDVFTVPFSLGGDDSKFGDPATVVISESSAKKYFGDENPLGKLLRINDLTDYEVTGVFEDMPNNSHFQMNVVVPYESYFRDSANDITSWTSNFSYTYFLMRAGADIASLQENIHQLIEQPLFERFGVPRPYPNMYFAQPLTDIHLKSHSMQEISVNNDIKYVYLFASIAFLILAIACINYVNLATAKSTRRGKEVGIRKVVGAKRPQLILQFLGESFFIVLLALGVGVLIVDLVLPTFSGLVERQFSMREMISPDFLFGLTAVVILVGLLAGLYPAIAISAFKPASVLKGTMETGPGGSKLRNTLVLFQFIVTTVLLVCTLTIKQQLDFVDKFDVGYQKQNIFSVKIRDSAVRQNIEAIRSELLKNPDVTDVAVSARLPSDIDTFTSKVLNSKYPENETTIFYNTADYEFVDLFGIEIVQGRNFSRNYGSDESGAFLINEAAVKAAGWESPLGEEMLHWSGETGQVVGVMKDFHLRSLHSPIEPLYIFLDPDNFSNIILKTKSDDLQGTIDFARSVMKRFSPSFPFEYSEFDEEFARVYHPEQRMVNLFGSFSALAIIVACFGLLGLSAFAAQKRTKEIAIRKVAGASVSKITLLLSTEYVRMVIFANLIAWPLAYFSMNRWLQNFAVRIDQGPVNYVVSSAVALLIAVATVSVLSAKAASARPIRALRHE